MKTIHTALLAYNTALTNLNTAINTENIKIVAINKANALARIPNDLITGGITPTAQLNSYNTARTDLENMTTVTGMPAVISNYDSALNNLNTAIHTENRRITTLYKSTALAKVPTALIT